MFRTFSTFQVKGTTKKNYPTASALQINERQQFSKGKRIKEKAKRTLRRATAKSLSPTVRLVL